MPQVSKAYLGSTPVKEAYLGTTKILGGNVLETTTLQKMLYHSDTLRVPGRELGLPEGYSALKAVNARVTSLNGKPVDIEIHGWERSDRSWDIIRRDPVGYTDLKLKRYEYDEGSRESPIGAQVTIEWDN